MLKKILVLILFLTFSQAGYCSVVTSGVKPRLVIQIVVGQMRYDYLMRYSENLSDDGFKTLISEGTSCDRATYNFMGTSTPSGLATIVTGSNPSVHGIIGNEWFNINSMSRQKILEDKNYYTIGADEYDNQFSPCGMFTPTITDEIKSMSPYSKVISVAYDAESAVIMGGHTADAAYWVNHREGHFVSDTYYMTKLPEWVDKFNAEGFAEKYNSEDWKPLLPSLRYKNVISSDIQMNNQSKLSELAQQILSGKKKWENEIFRATPSANTLIKDFAIQAIIYENMGKDNTTDFLSIVFDPSRYIGEKYGVQSIETEDCFYRIDREIASLLSFIKANFKKEEVLIVLTSDHGAADHPSDINKMPNGLFNAEQFKTLINGFVGAQHGGDKKWVLDFVNNQLYLNTDQIYQSHLSLVAVEQEVAGFAIQFRGVSQAFTSSSLTQGSASTGVKEFAQNSYFPKYGGSVVICMLPGWILQEDFKKSDSGTSYNYDTHVPLIFWGTMIGTKDLADPIDMCDVAPTISSLMGIVAPAASVGHPIMEVYSERQQR